MLRCSIWNAALAGCRAVTMAAPGEAAVPLVAGLTVIRGRSISDGRPGGAISPWCIGGEGPAVRGSCG